jgi:hypothetical protein
MIIQIPPFLENGRFYRENTYKCSPLVTKWQIILHFHCCFNNKATPWGNEMKFTEKIEKELIYSSNQNL